MSLSGKGALPREFADGFNAECLRDHDLGAELATVFQELPVLSIPGGLARNRIPEESRSKTTAKRHENHWVKVIVLGSLSETSDEIEGIGLVF